MTRAKDVVRAIYYHNNTPYMVEAKGEHFVVPGYGTFGIYKCPEAPTTWDAVELATGLRVQRRAKTKQAGIEATIKLVLEKGPEEAHRLRKAQYRRGMRTGLAEYDVPDMEYPDPVVKPEPIKFEDFVKLLKN